MLTATLEHIAEAPCASDERVSRALVAVKAYISSLYAHLGIGAANRLPVSVKSSADQSLAEQRCTILAAEIHAEEPARMVFTAARHRMEMARRVLASRIVEDHRTAAQRSCGCALSATLMRQDRLRIAAMRKGLDDREQIARSRAAIEESRSLLAIAALVFQSDPPHRALMAGAAPASAA